MQTLIELEKTDANCVIIFILPHDLILPHDIPSNSYGLINIPLIIYVKIIYCAIIHRAIFSVPLLLFYSVIYVVLLISAFNSLRLKA